MKSAETQVSRRACDFARARGGSIYVWAKPFGGFATLAASTRPPDLDDVQFLPRSGVEGLRVLSPHDLLPMPVKIRLRRFPRKRLVASPRDPLFVPGSTGGGV
jgi:hypothetical protein